MPGVAHTNLLVADGGHIRWFSAKRKVALMILVKSILLFHLFSLASSKQNPLIAAPCSTQPKPDIQSVFSMGHFASLSFHRFRRISRENEVRRNDNYTWYTTWPPIPVYTWQKLMCILNWFIQVISYADTLDHDDVGLLIVFQVLLITWGRHRYQATRPRWRSPACVHILLIIVKCLSLIIMRIFTVFKSIFLMADKVCFNFFI